MQSGGTIRVVVSLSRGALRFSRVQIPIAMRMFPVRSRMNPFPLFHPILSSASRRAVAIRSSTTEEGLDPKGETRLGDFFSRPLPERLAAITVARFMTSSTAEAQTGNEPKGEATDGEGGGMESPPPPQSSGMPLSRFLDQIPTATREAIQQSRLPVVEWIQRTTLLEIRKTAAAADEAAAREDARANSPKEAAPPCEPLASAVASESDPAGLRVRTRGGEKAAVELLSQMGELETSPGGDSRRVIFARLDRFLRAEGARTGRRYCLLNDAYLGVLRAAAVANAVSAPALPDPARSLRYDDFEALVLRDESFRAGFWVHQDRLITWRTPEERTAPRFTPSRGEPSKACAENNYAGWGTACGVPTPEDVAEILKYIPVNWGNMGNLGIPPAVKKSRIRVSSPLQWFRRQPYYFELRDMAGTVEIRRSVVLHPEAHGLTPEEARAQLALAIETRQANRLIPLGADGRPLPEAMTSVEKAIRKFFFRVCPPYFAPLSLVMQRYTKKNLTEAHLLDMAKRLSEDFQIHIPRHAGVPLVRRRVGVDSARWEKDFVEDLERFPEDVPGILAIMNRLCPTWDRPEYVYVRLSPTEQQKVGGYDGMMQILQRHPEIFRVGKRFVCRVDSSDPLTRTEEEPDGTDMTSRTYLRVENPYLSPLDIAKVFHYVMPPDNPCSLALFVECASPAMRVALPPRIVTILQQFPRLFACRETAPGVYSIHKINAPTSTTPHRESEPAKPHESLHAGGVVGRDPKQPEDPLTKTSGCGGGCEGDSSWLLESEIAAEANLSRTDVIQAVKDLIPHNGVESANLLFWASLSVQRAANNHYGGLIKMVESEKKHFRVVDSADSKMIYRA
ncbi:unnamed protein product [Phytomonas sp. EM1]|nr:unnamed protein product [Phytomonas sp. EM1]|eukprot:CCW61972.1 unnamed protein product [Phytomonas sp. isolate EM1]